MADAAEREAIFLGEKVEELRPALIELSILSEQDFYDKVMEMVGRLDGSPARHPVTNDVITADIDVYKQAVLNLHNELRANYRRADEIFASDLDGSDLDSVEKLGKEVAEKHPASSAASIAARRYEQQLIEAERQRERDGKKWTFELWRDYYKKYREDPSAYKFDEAEAALKAAGWDGVDNEDNYLQELFATAGQIEDKIAAITPNITKASVEDLQEIEKLFPVLEAQTATATITEVKVLHNRLWMRYQDLRRLWTTGVEINVVDEVEDEMLPDEFPQYKTYVQTLIRLRDQLTLLKENPKMPDDALLGYIRKRVDVIKQGSDFLREFEVMNSPSFSRLESLHLQVLEESETLLGIQLDESENVFTEDIKWWMFTHHGDQWWATRRLWAKYSTNTDTALSFVDRQEAEELRNYFSGIIADLDSHDHAGGDDVAKYHRFLAIDIQLNRLEELVDKAPTEEVVIEAEDAVSPDGKTKAELDKADLEKLTPEELYHYGYILLTAVNADMDPFTSTKKGPVNERFEFLIKELKTRGEIITSNGKTTSGEKMAEYFTLRRVFDALTNHASNSVYAMSYDALKEGDPANGLKGAKTPTFFNERQVMKLLYGLDFADAGNMTVDARGGVDVESDDGVENERLLVVNRVLQIATELFTEDNNPPGATHNDYSLRGEFHCTQQVNDEFKERFMAKMQAELTTELRNEGILGPDEDMSFEHQQDFELAVGLMVFIDLRTYLAMSYYLAGWSPQDQIGGSIGVTAKRLENGKGMYIICGKGQQLVNPALQVSLFSHEVESRCDSTIKVDNLRFTADYGTPIWSNWWAPTLDDAPGLSDDEKVVFRRKDGEMMVPGFYGMFWLPHTRGQTQADSAIDPTTRNYVLAASGKKDIPNVSREINLDGMLNGSEAAEKYIENCEAGFSPSGDMEKDVEGIKKATTEAVALGISPTKALGTINARYLANAMYQYCRLSLLSFGEKYHGEKDYQHHYRLFLDNLRSTIKTAPTATIKIPAETIPDAFRSRYGLPPISDGDVKIYDYVLSLLPESVKVLGGLATALGVDQGKRHHRVEEDVVQQIAFAVQAHPRMDENNKGLLKEHREQEGFFIEEWIEKIEDLIRAGKHAKQLEGHYHPVSPGLEPATLYRALDIIDLTKGSKQAEGED